MESGDALLSSNKLAILLIATLPLVLLWAFIVCRRIYRLSFSLQMDTYNSQRFLHRLMHDRNEGAYWLGNLLASAILTGIVVWFVTMVRTAQDIEQEGVAFVFLLFGGPAILGLDYVLALVTLIYLPRSRRLGQENNDPWRIRRLAVIAIILDATIAVGISELVLASQYSASPATIYADWMLIAGSIATLLCPLALALSNGIVWLIELMLNSKQRSIQS